MSARLPCRYVSPYARLQPPITQTLQVSTEPSYVYTKSSYTHTMLYEAMYREFGARYWVESRRWAS